MFQQKVWPETCWNRKPKNILYSLFNISFYKKESKWIHNLSQISKIQKFEVSNLRTVDSLSFEIDADQQLTNETLNIWYEKLHEFMINYTSPLDINGLHSSKSIVSDKAYSKILQKVWIYDSKVRIKCSDGITYIPFQ